MTSIDFAYQRRIAGEPGDDALPVGLRDTNG
jgi:hypothetical protein